MCASRVVKICGVRDAAAVNAAAMAGASHLGFVFYPKSPRFLNVHEAVALRANSSKETRIVALVVDLEPSAVTALVESLKPDAVQFHGDESPERLLALKDEFCGELEIWKALGMAAPADLDAADRFHGVVDRLLFDARPPRGAERPGGHGDAFDWNILRGYDGATPWILAGGLTPENVAEAIDIASTIPRFCGVDVSSGVERASGVKDREKIARFVRNAHHAWALREDVS